MNNKPGTAPRLRLKRSESTSKHQGSFFEKYSISKCSKNLKGDPLDLKERYSSPKVQKPTLFPVLSPQASP